MSDVCMYVHVCMHNVHVYVCLHLSSNHHPFIYPLILYTSIQHPCICLSTLLIKFFVLCRQGYSEQIIYILRKQGENLLEINSFFRNKNQFKTASLG